jgi:hypothetical protein
LAIDSIDASFLRELEAEFPAVPDLAARAKIHKNFLTATALNALAPSVRAGDLLALLILASRHSPIALWDSYRFQLQRDSTDHSFSLPPFILSLFLSNLRQFHCVADDPLPPLSADLVDPIVGAATTDSPLRSLAIDALCDVSVRTPLPPSALAALAPSETHDCFDTIVSPSERLFLYSPECSCLITNCASAKRKPSHVWFFSKLGAFSA